MRLLLQRSPALPIARERDGERVRSPASTRTRRRTARIRKSTRHLLGDGVAATQATLRGGLVAGEQLARSWRGVRGDDLEQNSVGRTSCSARRAVPSGPARSRSCPTLRSSAAVLAFRAGAALPALAHAATGRLGTACAIAWETLGPDGDDLRRDVFWLAAVALFAGVAAKAADHELIDLCSALLESSAGDHVIVFGTGATVFGSGAFLLGALGTRPPAVWTPGSSTSTRRP